VRGRAGQHFANLLGQFGRNDFVGIEQQNPITGAVVDGDVLLLAVTRERLVDENLRSERFGNRSRAIRGAAIDDRNLIGPSHTREGARQVRLFIFGDHRDRESLRHERGRPGGEGSAPPEPWRKCNK